MNTDFRKTRIIATLGPASSAPVMISQLISTGVNVFRLNFSHAEQETHESVIQHVRQISKDLGLPVGVLQDLQGPKIRIGTFANDQVHLDPGDRFSLYCEADGKGDDKGIIVSYPNLYQDISVGDSILLDDGRLRLQVVDVKDKTIITMVEIGGELSNNKGVNVPGADLRIPSLTDKDISDIAFGAKLDVDWVAMSFVRDRDDILLARHYMNRANSRAKLMAKIEKPGAVRNFSAILSASDGIMIARGDLGVELSTEQVPIIQKRLIGLARGAGKPVITATQMLESMVDNPTPTRAEASDVANAIYDGTDGIMLSAETAVGSYPIEAVSMMVRIATDVEADDEFQRTSRMGHPNPEHTIADAVSLAACEMAHNLDADVIVTFSSSGSTALRVSRNRYATPIIAYTTRVKTYHQLCLSWGVLPLLGDELHSTDHMVELANEAILKTGIAKPGDCYVITAGVPFGVIGTTNMIRIETVK